MLKPTAPDAAPARLATKGPGIIGETVRDTKSRDVGVVRQGRKLTFFIFGPGFSNVDSAEVSTFVKASRAGRAAKRGTGAADTTGPVKTSPTPLTCEELKASLDALKVAIDFDKKALEKAEKALKEMEERQDVVLDALQKLLDKLGVLKNPTSAASREAVRQKIKELKQSIKDLEAWREKLIESIGKCAAGANQPPVVNSFGAVFGPPATCEACTLYTVEATDPEGGALTYSWSKAPPPGGAPAATNCGTFTPSSPATNQAVWDHPNEGASACSHAAGEHPGHITVVVTDAQGAQVSFTDINGSANYTYP